MSAMDPSASLIASAAIDMKAEGAVLLKDATGTVKFRGKICELTCQHEQLIITNKDGKVLAEVCFSDVLGASVATVKGDSTSFVLHIFRYIMPTGWFASKSRVAAHIELKMAQTSMECCSNWANVINALSSKQPLAPAEPAATLPNGQVIYKAPRQRKILVFVNPHSGQGTAQRLWKNHAEHMYQEANVEVILVTTTHANHAREYVTGLDLDAILSFDGIATVGGDGILSEVVNGIGSRADSHQVLRNVPLIPIPGGTSNGLVKSILFEGGEEYSMVNAIFWPLKGVKAPIDLSLVTTKSLDKMHSFLIMAWGLIGDIDILSESMRWMGEMRLYVAAVFLMLRNRTYHGRLSILPATEETKGFGVDDMPSIQDTLPGCESLTPYDPHAKRESLSDVSTTTQAGRWQVIEGGFSMVLVVQSSHCSSSVYSGPGLTVNDGVFTIYVLRASGRCAVLQFLLGFDSGDFVNFRCIETYKARAYRLEPLESEKGIFSMDGESIEYGAVQAVMQPSLATILMKKVTPAAAAKATA